MDRITPCLWFDTEAEEAAAFYTSVFPNARIVHVSHYGSAGPRPEGMVMEVEFEIDGRSFLALNGGPQFRFTEAISLQADCRDQAEVDRLWDTLSEGGEEGPCGWLKDRYGVSWQIVPSRMYELIADPDPERAQRAVAAMLQMGKLDIAELERAADGVGAPAR
jgi:predicted 3-demethylubiquinone-9 3-methyltransferase (glyoxalase superfamily)